MKKNILIKMICMLLAVVFLMSALAACDEEPAPPETPPTTPSNPGTPTLTDAEKAYTLYAAAEAAMNDIDSGTQHGEITLELSLYGLEMEVTMDMFSCVANLKNDNLSYYMQTDMSGTMAYSGDTSVMSAQKAEGFQNGKMFVRNEQTEDGVVTQNQKMYSLITAADFKAYMDWASSDLAVNATTCKKALYSAGQDGGAVLTFSKFTDEALRTLDFGVGDFNAVFEDEFELVDVIYTVYVSADSTVTKEQMNFIFDYADDADAGSYCSLSAQTVYSKINTTLPYETVSLTGYREVDDLRVVNVLDKLLNDFVNGDSGEFSMHSDVEVVLAGYTDVSEVVQTGSFSKTNGKYGFEIMIDRDGTISTVAYANGVLYTKDGQTEYSESAARSVVRSGVDPAEISMSDVEDISLVTQTSTQSVYTLLLNDVSQAEEWAAVANGTLASATVTATLTFSGGKLTRYDYVCEAIATTAYGNMTISLETYVVYG